MNIVVLAGGISTERAVSIVSGTEVCKALRKKGHKAVPVDVYCGIEAVEEQDFFPAEYDVDAAAAYIRSFDEKIDEMKESTREFFGPKVIAICQKSDIVFMALHGENGENGKIQACFDLQNILYTGTGHLGSAMAMDKGITKQIFLGANVPTPSGITLKKGEGSEQLSEYGMKFPVVVKPCCGGSSVGVDIVYDQESYEKALSDAFSYEEEVVVEEYIKGREFSVGVLNGKALPVIEIQPVEGFYNYENKYKAGAVIETCPAELSQELTVKMQKYAEAGYQALALQAYGRLDFMMTEEGDMYCLEANTLPGMTPTSLLPQEAQAVGMNFAALCEELIKISLAKYQ